MNHSELIHYVEARLAESRDKRVPCKLGRRLSVQEQRALRADLRMERFTSLRSFIQEIDGAFKA